jgi:hypothetical protein
LYLATFNKAASSAVLTHCRREIIQAIWLLLLDPEFMNAYQFGIVLEFLDGIRQQFFPHFLTYSADYPERCV